MRYFCRLFQDAIIHVVVFCTSYVGRGTGVHIRITGRDRTAGTKVDPDDKSIGLCKMLPRQVRACRYIGTKGRIVESSVTRVLCSLHCFVTLHEARYRYGADECSKLIAGNYVHNGCLSHIFKLYLLNV